MSQTLARDARALVDADYSLGEVSGLDLFPNTAHVETICVFLSSQTPHSVNKSFEQRSEFSCAPEILRVPLHAEDKTAARILDRFESHRRAPSPSRPALRRARSAPGGDGCSPRTNPPLLALAHRALEQAVRRQPDIVRDGEARLLDAVLDRGADFLGDVLDERAARATLQDLHAAANREDRQVLFDRAAHQLDLELVASRLGRDRTSRARTRRR
jgi:hypothetical protein